MHCALWWLNCFTTRAGNKDQWGWCQYEDHSFRVHILQLEVSAGKGQLCFHQRRRSWIDSKATGVERAGGRASNPDLAAAPAVWEPLTISGHLFFHFNFSVCLSTELWSRLICRGMHVLTHTKEAICYRMNQRSGNPKFTSSLWGHLSQNSQKIIHIKLIKERKARRMKGGGVGFPVLAGVADGPLGNTDISLQKRIHSWHEGLLRRGAYCAIAG